VTITARHAARRLQRLQPVVAQVADTIAETVTAIRQQIDDDRAGKPRAEDVGIRGLNWISRPTEDAAVANIEASRSSLPSRHLDALADDINELVAIVGRLAATCERYTYSGRPTDLEPDPRCSGGKGHGVADWVRPDCENPAARHPGTDRLRGDGLCDACRMAKSRWERRQGAA
jgi:hypothetical protein